MEDSSLRDRTEAAEERTQFGLLYGRSAPMQSVYMAIERVAPTDIAVFIQGESGTGKELAAQTLYDLSRRREGMFVPVNCGALSPSLIESELFGHERGSFTGATRQHRGCFERANGGTLFLDEITEMQPDLQVKLLRVLETGRLVRLGGQESVPVDVRVIAATNDSPAQAVADGKLREDLYFRLSIFPIRLPALRERPGDVDLLAHHFLQVFNAASVVKKSITPAAMTKLRRYSWPGNVRELKNLLQRAYILADDQIDADHLPLLETAEPMRPANGDVTVTVGTNLRDMERRLILATLAHYHGDKRQAAEVLGISLKTIYNRLRSYEKNGELS